MKRIVLLIGCLAAAAACASSVFPDQLPRGEYADTEATTNMPFAFAPECARNFQFELSLAGTPSNNVQLAFGRDADSDGVLSAEETDISVAWDCGEWKIVNGETGEVIGASAATTNDAKTLTWDLVLRRGLPRSLSLSENGEPVFAELADAPAPWLYSPDWDILRLKVRGVDAPQENVRVGVDIAGYILRVR